MDIEWTLFFASTFIPAIFLSGSWLLTRKKKVVLRIACTGIATLISLPGAFEFNLFVVGLFHGWDFFFHPGNHSPGIGVVNIFAIVGWLACMVVWLTMLAFAIAKKRPIPPSS